MSDSQTVTIPAADHAATAETRPARLLRALARNPEPLSAPALASLLAEPSQRHRLLASYDRILRQHELRTEQAAPKRRVGRHLAHLLKAALARRHDSTSPRAAAAALHNAKPSSTAHGHRTEPRTGPSPRHLQPQLRGSAATRRAAAQRSRLHLDQIGAVFHVSKGGSGPPLAARTSPRMPKPRKPPAEDTIARRRHAA
jgi:hypothetical protein